MTTRGRTPVAPLCRHCRRPIVLGPRTPDPYWYHPANQSVYCNLTDAARSPKAEPVGRDDDR